ncbi:MAG: hypothetical protein ACU85U_19665 [Gammaproteobacteria bacterium]
MKRRADRAPEEFRRFWNDPEYLEVLNAAFEATHAVRMARNLTLQVEVNRALRELHDQEEAFDAVVEIWWESAEKLFSGMSAEQTGDVQLRLNAFEDDYVDRAASRFFFTEVS